ncbi:MAG: DUF2231 domain-containing protein [bacterium]
MGPTDINGLPAHALLVHFVVIFVPVAAAAVLLSVFWPAARARLGIVTPLVAFGALVSVPITTHAGQWLKDHIGGTSPLIQRHAQLGGELLPWVLGLFVVAAGQWVWFRWYAPRRAARSTGTFAVLCVLAVVVSVGSVVQVYRIGDSGSKAVWSGVTR